ncbi:hypothetical protein VNO78_31657 [Psophocarpus tetragonolobus]|uniref:Uncharacterized protein n=1 Tax=Psophocarpus tetragonolobus TaxID=3891 RepID=A0AAN9S0P1_PSOTE
MLVVSFPLWPVVNVTKKDNFDCQRGHNGTGQVASYIKVHSAPQTTEQPRDFLNPLYKHYYYPNKNTYTPHHPDNIKHCPLFLSQFQPRQDQVVNSVIESC